MSNDLIEGYCSCGRHRSDQCAQCCQMRDSKATDDETTAPEIKVGQAIRAVQAAVDDLIILANIEETRALVCRERIELGIMLTRIELLCSFAMAVKPGPMLVRRVS